MSAKFDDNIRRAINYFPRPNQRNIQIKKKKKWDLSFCSLLINMEIPEILSSSCEEQHPSAATQGSFVPKGDFVGQTDNGFKDARY